jgi:hypothetical protein
MFYNGEVGYFAKQYGKPNPNMADFEKWGHFSQIVWAATTTVGCATYDCSGQGLSNTGGGVAPYFTVCNYKNPGRPSSRKHLEYHVRFALTESRKLRRQVRRQHQGSRRPPPYHCRHGVQGLDRLLDFLERWRNSWRGIASLGVRAMWWSKAAVSRNFKDFIRSTVAQGRNFFVLPQCVVFSSCSSFLWLCVSVTKTVKKFIALSLSPTADASNNLLCKPCPERRTRASRGVMFSLLTG